MEVEHDLGHLLALLPTQESLPLEHLAREEKQVAWVKHVVELGDLTEVHLGVGLQVTVRLFPNLLDCKVGPVQEVLVESAPEFLALVVVTLEEAENLLDLSLSGNLRRRVTEPQVLVRS